MHSQDSASRHGAARERAGAPVGSGALHLGSSTSAAPRSLTLTLTPTRTLTLTLTLTLTRSPTPAARPSSLRSAAAHCRRSTVSSWSGNLRYFSTRMPGGAGHRVSYYLSVVLSRDFPPEVLRAAAARVELWQRLGSLPLTLLTLTLGNPTHAWQRLGSPWSTTVLAAVAAAFGPRSCSCSGRCLAQPCLSPQTSTRSL